MGVCGVVPKVVFTTFCLAWFIFPHIYAVDAFSLGTGSYDFEFNANDPRASLANVLTNGTQILLNLRSPAWLGAHVTYANSGLSFGTHVFYVEVPVGGFDPNVLLVVSATDSGTLGGRFAQVEIGGLLNGKDPTNADFVVQQNGVPGLPGSSVRFSVDPTFDTITFVFSWGAEKVELFALRGFYDIDQLVTVPFEDIISMYTTDKAVPLQGDLQFDVSLTTTSGKPPINGREVTVTLVDFQTSQDALSIGDLLWPITSPQPPQQLPLNLSLPILPGTDPLVGFAQCPDSAGPSCKCILYVRNSYGWVSKPSPVAPSVLLDSDNQFHVWLSAGTFDSPYTRLAAFLVPSAFPSFSLNGVTNLPPRLLQYSLGSSIVNTWWASSQDTNAQLSKRPAICVLTPDTSHYMSGDISLLQRSCGMDVMKCTLYVFIQGAKGVWSGIDATLVKWSISPCAAADKGLLVDLLQVVGFEKVTKVAMYLVSNGRDISRTAALLTTSTDPNAAAIQILQERSVASLVLERPLLQFKGYPWSLKHGDQPQGPGPNLYSPRSSDVWVDNDGMHLSIVNRDGKWYSTEVILEQDLGYGTYVFELTGDIANLVLDPNVVIGMFTWEDAGTWKENPDWPYREFDFEFGRFGSASDPTNAQFVVQPWTLPGNNFRFSTTPSASSDDVITCIVMWRQRMAVFYAYSGKVAVDQPLDQSRLIAKWKAPGTKTRSSVPPPGEEKIHVNLWLNAGQAPVFGTASDDRSVILSDFAFFPLDTKTSETMCRATPVRSDRAAIVQTSLGFVMPSDTLLTIYGSGFSPLPWQNAVLLSLRSPSYAEQLFQNPRCIVMGVNDTALNCSVRGLGSKGTGNLFATVTVCGIPTNPVQVAVVVAGPPSCFDSASPNVISADGELLAKDCRLAPTASKFCRCPYPTFINAQGMDGLGAKACLGSSAIDSIMCPRGLDKFKALDNSAFCMSINNDPCPGNYPSCPADFSYGVDTTGLFGPTTSTRCVCRPNVGSYLVSVISSQSVISDTALTSTLANLISVRGADFDNTTSPICGPSTAQPPTISSSDLAVLRTRDATSLVIQFTDVVYGIGKTKPSVGMNGGIKNGADAAFALYTSNLGDLSQRASLNFLSVKGLSDPRIVRAVLSETSAVTMSTMDLAKRIAAAIRVSPDCVSVLQVLPASACLLKISPSQRSMSGAEASWVLRSLYDLNRLTDLSNPDFIVYEVFDDLPSIAHMYADVFVSPKPSEPFNWIVFMVVLASLLVLFITYMLLTIWSSQRRTAKRPHAYDSSELKPLKANEAPMGMMEQSDEQQWRMLKGFLNDVHNENWGFDATVAARAHSLVKKEMLDWIRTRKESETVKEALERFWKMKLKNHHKWHARMQSAFGRQSSRQPMALLRAYVVPIVDTMLLHIPLYTKYFLMSLQPKRKTTSDPGPKGRTTSVTIEVDGERSDERKADFNSCAAVRDLYLFAAVYSSAANFRSPSFMAYLFYACKLLRYNSCEGLGMGMKGVGGTMDKTDSLKDKDERTCGQYVQAEVSYWHRVFTKSKVMREKKCSQQDYITYSDLAELYMTPQFVMERVSNTTSRLLQIRLDAWSRAHALVVTHQAKNAWPKALPKDATKQACDPASLFEEREYKAGVTHCHTCIKTYIEHSRNRWYLPGLFSLVWNVWPMFEIGALRFAIHVGYTFQGKHIRIGSYDLAILWSSVALVYVLLQLAKVFLYIVHLPPLGMWRWVERPLYRARALERRDWQQSILRLMLLVVMEGAIIVIDQSIIFAPLGLANYVPSESLPPLERIGWFAALVACLWIPAFFAFLLSSQIIYVVTLNSIAVFKGLFNRFSGVHTWRDVQKQIGRAREKLFEDCIPLGQDCDCSQSHYRETLQAWVRVWEALIQGLRQRHLLTEEEANRMVYQGVPHPDLQTIPSSMPNVAAPSLNRPALSIYDTVRHNPLEAINFDPQSVADFCGSGTVHTAIRLEDDRMLQQWDEEQLQRILSMAPRNHEARRRIFVFLSGLLMKKPTARTLEQTPSLTVMVPAGDEAVIYSERDLLDVDPSGICVLEHIIAMHPREWSIFVDDKIVTSRETLRDLATSNLRGGIRLCWPRLTHQEKDAVRMWASMRFQPLARTLAGIMSIFDAYRVMAELQTPLSANNADNAHRVKEYHQRVEGLVRSKLQVIFAYQNFQKRKQEAEDVLILNALRKHRDGKKLTFDEAETVLLWNTWGRKPSEALTPKDLATLSAFIVNNLSACADITDSKRSILKSTLQNSSNRPDAYVMDTLASVNEQKISGLGTGELHRIREAIVAACMHLDHDKRLELSLTLIPNMASVADKFDPSEEEALLRWEVWGRRPSERLDEREVCAVADYLVGLPELANLLTDEENRHLNYAAAKKNEMAVTFGGDDTKRMDRKLRIRKAIVSASHKLTKQRLASLTETLLVTEKTAEARRKAEKRRYEEVLKELKSHLMTTERAGEKRKSVEEGAVKYTDVLTLMRMYDALELVFIEEYTEGGQKKYRSTRLRKGGKLVDSVPLPGDVLLMYPKGENQNHAVIYAENQIMCAIDCNQDFYVEEAFKIPSVLQEFMRDKHVKIVGFPEEVITARWNAVARMSGVSERLFTTMTQRGLAMFGVRNHYGHPDFIDGTYMRTSGGLSNTQYVSEDIFKGFDCNLAGYRIIQAEYLQGAKARDTSMLTTSKFNDKISQGAAQMGLSREYGYMLQSANIGPVRRAFLFNTTLSPFLVGAFLVKYGVLVLLLSKVLLACIQPALLWVATPTDVVIGGLVTVLFSGFPLALPMFLENILELGFGKGLLTSITDFVSMLLYHTFHLLTMASGFLKGLKSDASYIPSGRGFGLNHERLDFLLNQFYPTHFAFAFFMMFVIILKEILVNQVLIPRMFAIVSEQAMDLVDTSVVANMYAHASEIATESQSIVGYWNAIMFIVVAFLCAFFFNPGCLPLGKFTMQAVAILRQDDIMYVISMRKQKPDFLRKARPRGNIRKTLRWLVSFAAASVAFYYELLVKWCIAAIVLFCLWIVAWVVHVLRPASSKKQGKVTQATVTALQNLISVAYTRLDTIEQARARELIPELQRGQSSIRDPTASQTSLASDPTGSLAHTMSTLNPYASLRHRKNGKKAETITPTMVVVAHSLSPSAVSSLGSSSILPMNLLRPQANVESSLQHSIPLVRVTSERHHSRHSVEHVRFQEDMDEITERLTEDERTEDASDAYSSQHRERAVVVQHPPNRVNRRKSPISFAEAETMLMEEEITPEEASTRTTVNILLDMADHIPARNTLEDVPSHRSLRHLWSYTDAEYEPLYLELSQSQQQSERDAVPHLVNNMHHSQT